MLETKGRFAPRTAVTIPQIAGVSRPPSSYGSALTHAAAVRLGEVRRVDSKTPTLSASLQLAAFLAFRPAIRAEFRFCVSFGCGLRHGA